jgi:hypothetical protein
MRSSTADAGKAVEDTGSGEYYESADRSANQAGLL